MAYQNMIGKNVTVVIGDDTFEGKLEGSTSGMIVLNTASGIKVFSQRIIDSIVCKH